MARPDPFKQLQEAPKPVKKSIFDHSILKRTKKVKTTTAAAPEATAADGEPVAPVEAESADVAEKEVAEGEAVKNEDAKDVEAATETAAEEPVAESKEIEEPKEAPVAESPSYKEVEDIRYRSPFRSNKKSSKFATLTKSTPLQVPSFLSKIDVKHKRELKELEISKKNLEALKKQHDTELQKEKEYEAKLLEEEKKRVAAVEERRKDALKEAKGTPKAVVPKTSEAETVEEEKPSEPAEVEQPAGETAGAKDVENDKDIEPLSSLEETPLSGPADDTIYQDEAPLTTEADDEVRLAIPVSESREGELAEDELDELKDETNAEGKDDAEDVTDVVDESTQPEGETTEITEPEVEAETKEVEPIEAETKEVEPTEAETKEVEPVEAETKEVVEDTEAKEAKQESKEVEPESKPKTKKAPAPAPTPKKKLFGILPAGLFSSGEPPKPHAVTPVKAPKGTTPNREAKPVSKAVAKPAAPPRGPLTVREKIEIKNKENRAKIAASKQKSDAQLRQIETSYDSKIEALKKQIAEIESNISLNQTNTDKAIKKANTKFDEKTKELDAKHEEDKINYGEETELKIQQKNEEIEQSKINQTAAIDELKELEAKQIESSEGLRILEEDIQVLKQNIRVEQVKQDELTKTKQEKLDEIENWKTEKRELIESLKKAKESNEGSGELLSEDKEEEYLQNITKINQDIEKLTKELEDTEQETKDSSVRQNELEQDLTTKENDQVEALEQKTELESLHEKAVSKSQIETDKIESQERELAELENSKLPVLTEDHDEEAQADYLREQDELLRKIEEAKARREALANELKDADSDLYSTFERESIIEVEVKSIV